MVVTTNRVFFSRTHPGLLAAGAIAAIAWPLGRLEPLAGAPVIALALGIAARTSLGERPLLVPGLAFCARYVLQAAIVVLGATLSLGQVGSVGRATLPVLVGTLGAAFVVSAVAGRLLGVSPRLRTLVGVGTGICGASAIAAVSGIVAATEAEIAYAVTTIFAFNLVAVLLFPPVGHLLGLSQPSFGVWAGTAVNDTSSVVAAAYAYGPTAGAHAVLVKLTRTVAILPVAGALALRRRDGAERAHWARIVPWFLVWFAVAAALDTVGVVPTSAHDSLQQLAVVLITIALAAVGLTTNLGALRRAGARPLLLGTLVWIAVATSSLVLQAVA